MVDVRQINPGGTTKVSVVFGRADYQAMFSVFAAAWVYIWGSSYLGEGRWLVFSLVYMGANLYYARRRQREIPRESWLYVALVLASALCLIEIGAKSLSSEIAAGFYLPVFLFFHAFGVYFVMTLNGNRINHCLDEEGIRDILRGIFIIPFRYFFRFLQGIIGGAGTLLTPRLRANNQEGMQNTWQLLIGAGIGTLALIATIPLLMLAEESFSTFMHALGGVLVNAPIHLVHFIRGENILVLLVACYLYGLAYGAGKSKTPTPIAHTPTLTLAAVTSQIFICGAYLLFFVVKLWDVMATSSQGRGTFVYSEYARGGFFELCRIAFINMLIYYLIRYMSVRGSRKNNILSTILCLETIGFIALAFYKMQLYIDVYGYTFKRVITLWFMAVLLVGFVLFIYKVWRRFNAIRVTVLFGAVSLLLLAYLC